MIEVPALSRPKRLFMLIAGVVAVGIVAAVDERAGPEISFSVFYLIPIIACGWYAGEATGLFLAFMSAAVWLLLEIRAVPFSHAAIPYWNASMRLVLYSIVIIAIGRLQASLRREEELARHDSLTGAANGRTFHERIEHEVQRSRRTGSPFTVSYMDLDNFKQVNDQYGHPMGDQVLMTVVDTMQRQMRATDLVARLGGDEFALFQPETDVDGAVSSLKKVREAILAAMKARNWPVTVSIGSVTFRTPPDEISELIRRADHLLYEVKRSGKDGFRHEVFNDT